MKNLKKVALLSPQEMFILRSGIKKKIFQNHWKKQLNYLKNQNLLKKLLEKMSKNIMLSCS